MTPAGVAGPKTKNAMARKEIIEEIMASLNAMKNKIHGAIMQADVKKRVPHSQWFVLCLISQNENMGIKEISAMLGITSSATTQLVDALVESGYVKRNTSTVDRRSLHLSLSASGQEHVKEMKSIYADSMKVLFEALTDQELEMYNALNKKILTNLL